MSDSTVLSQEIAKTAYELYEKRGMTDGNDLTDWLKAEKIVRERMSAKSKKEASSPLQGVKLESEKKKNKKVFAA